MTLQRTSLEGIRTWSRWQPDRRVYFNSFYVHGSESIVVDPLAIDAKDLQMLRAQGGARWIVVTNRDHERESRALAAALGAKIAASAADAPLVSASHADVYVNRINIDELSWRTRDGEPGRFGGSAAEIGQLIGARKLGYRLVRLPPGKVWCPLHWHQSAEELFLVLEGDATLRTPRGEYPVRRGDFIAFPTGPGGAHQVRNDSPRDCVILMLADNADGDDVCYYPDSRKVLISPGRLILRTEPRLEYFEGEPG